jgi:hypothetical protein
LHLADVRPGDADAVGALRQVDRQLLDLAAPEPQVYDRPDLVHAFAESPANLGLGLDLRGPVHRGLRFLPRDFQPVAGHEAHGAVRALLAANDGGRGASEPDLPRRIRLRGSRRPRRRRRSPRQAPLVAAAFGLHRGLGGHAIAARLIIVEPEPTVVGSAQRGRFAVDSHVAPGHGGRKQFHVPRKAARQNRHVERSLKDRFAELAGAQGPRGPLDPRGLGRLGRRRAEQCVADEHFVDRDGNFDLGLRPLGNSPEDFAGKFIAHRIRRGGRRKADKQRQKVEAMPHASSTSSVRALTGPADSTLLTRQAKKSSVKFGGAAILGTGQTLRGGSPGAVAESPFM